MGQRVGNVVFLVSSTSSMSWMSSMSSVEIDVHVRNRRCHAMGRAGGDAAF